MPPPGPAPRPSAPQACKYLQERLAIPTSALGADTLMAAAKTAMSSKIVGADSDFFGRLVVDAVTAVRSEDELTGRCGPAPPPAARPPLWLPCSPALAVLLSGYTASLHVR